MSEKNIFFTPQLTRKFIWYLIYRHIQRGKRIKEEGIIGRRTLGPTVRCLGILIILLFSLSVACTGELPYDEVEQDSLGNYHRVFIDNSTGNYQVYYTNDIGGDSPQDWNTSTQITHTGYDSMLLDLGIYQPTDRMFIIWSETTPEGNLTYYTVSGDYGENWTDPRRSYERIMLKYAEFDPLEGEPNIPLELKTNGTGYEYYIVQMKTPLYQDWHDGFVSAGAISCGYIPNNAYLMWMNDSVKNEMEQLPFFRWAGFFEPAYKIHAPLLEKDGLIELNVMVIEQTGYEANLDKVMQDIESLGGLTLYNGSGSYIIRTRILADKIDDIAHIPEVSWIDEVGEYWPRPPIQLHHISMIFEGSLTFNISETKNFTAVGWEDENETDLDRAWTPVWHVEGDIGEIIGDNFTVTFKAIKPGNGTIVCTDNETGKYLSIDIQVVGVTEDGEIEEFDKKEELPLIWVLVIAVIILIIVIAVMLRLSKKRKGEEGDTFHIKQI